MFIPPYGINVKTHATEKLMFFLPAARRLEIDQSIAHFDLAKSSMAITSILVKNARSKDRDIVQAILPLLRQDCITAMNTRPNATAS